MAPMSPLNSLNFFFTVFKSIVYCSWDHLAIRQQVWFCQNVKYLSIQSLSNGWCWVTLYFLIDHDFYFVKIRLLFVTWYIDCTWFVWGHSKAVPVYLWPTVRATIIRATQSESVDGERRAASSSFPFPVPPSLLVPAVGPYFNWFTFLSSAFPFVPISARIL